MTHVRTSSYYPQSNRKLERWHGSLWSECIRPGTLLCIEDARRLVKRYVDYYNNQRLHSALGYITPKDKLEGREEIVFADRERKLKEARQRRRLQKTESTHVDIQALELALVGS
ncbi:MAG: integrase core domain-containing protein [Anaerolineales bacterium]